MLGRATAAMGEAFTQGELQEAVAAADTDGNGLIDMEEFLRMMHMLARANDIKDNFNIN